MSSFLKSASKQVADVRNFLRESAGGNGIKYAAEKGAKHIIYIPYITETNIDPQTGAEVATRSICAISGKIHEWTTQDGKFKAVACLDGVVRKADDGTLINDGTCPFCNRIADAWDVCRYRKELEETNCKLTGEQRKNHLEKTSRMFIDERKAKEVRNYMYILVAKFRLNESGNPVAGTDGLPEYELKVMKLSASRVEKIQQQVANSGSELPDSELIFEYPNVDDRRLLVSQSTTAPVFPNNRLVAKFPALLNKINEDVSKFDWEGIDKAFPEWAGMTTEAAKSTVDAMFEQWDKYKKELLVNPQAKYLEYVVGAPKTNPNLSGDGITANVAGSIPVIPTIPGVTPVETPSAADAPVVPSIPTPETPVVPTMQVATPAAATSTITPGVPPTPTIPSPQAPVPDPNAVFSNGGAAPTIVV